ncbi:MAG TPA: cyclic nucleotide-binding domain-containing protein [Anaerolineales bacterium]|nr:cyclic nucleotide-binding domain-containing protein [Anaerolineales bacterium]
MGTTDMEGNPFLRGLTPEQHDLFSGLFVPIQLASGRTVFHQGDTATYMYVLLEGSVSILYKPYDGPRIMLTALHVGDVFGWSSVVGNPTYTSEAVTRTAGRGLRAAGADIRRMCSLHPTAGSQVLRRLALAVAPRWTDSQQQVERLLQQGILDGAEEPRADAPI